MVWVICVTVLAVTALLCFKGIVIHRKTEIVPPRPRSSGRFAHTAEEMEEIEKRLNALDEAGEERVKVPQDDDVTRSEYPMNKVLRNLQDVFGPELEEDNDGR